MLRGLTEMQSGDRSLVVLETMFVAANCCRGLVGLVATGALGGVGSWLRSNSDQWAILGTVSAAIAWAIFGSTPGKRNDEKRCALWI